MDKKVGGNNLHPYYSQCMANPLAYYQPMLKTITSLLLGHLIIVDKFYQYDIIDVSSGE